MTPPARPPSVWVLARHRLVAQALSAALGRDFATVHALVWEPRSLEGTRIDADHDLLLVVDDLESPFAVDAVSAPAPPRSVVMTTQPKGPSWGALLTAGATEIVGELTSVDELTHALERLGDGEPLIPTEEKAELRESWEQQVAEEEELLDRMATLSPRERAVLEGLVSGRRPAEIGEALGVQQSTVRTHVRSIRRKLGVNSQLRAVLVVHRLRGRSGPGPAAPAVPAQRGQPPVRDGAVRR